MSRLFWTALSLLVLVGLMSGTSVAQGGLPSGSYRTSCQNIRMNGDRLQARCQDRDGHWRDTSLDYRSCRGSITNDNGNLRCDNNGGGPWQGENRGPGSWRGGDSRGDYRDTCQNVRMNGDRLEARCQKRDGGWRDASIPYRACRGAIINDDGNLRCESGGSWQGRGGPVFNWPRGSRGDFRETCQNVRMNGNRLQARCQKRDGSWRDTSFDYGSCRGPIINDDGHLRCE